MAQRRESGRAVVRPSKARPKAAPTQKPRAKSQGSTGSNAAAAHGYTQKGPTRKLKVTRTPVVRGPQSLTRAAAKDRAEETQKGSVAQRGAVLRQRASKADEKRVAANAKAQRKDDGGGILHAVERAGRILAKPAAGALERTAGPGVKAAINVVASKKPKSIEKELTGAGEFAKAAKEAADFVGKNGRLISTGTSGGAASAALARKAKKEGGATVIAAATPKAVKAPKGLQRAAEDLINAPAQALPSLYVPAKAGVEAAKGNTKPLKQYAKDAAKNDPVVAAVTGHPGRALKLAEEHPGFTALELAGAKGAAGRGVGRATRGTGRVLKAAGAEKAGEAIRRVGATETRPDAVVPGTNLRESRSYSRDTTRKATQIVTDRVQTRRAAKLRQRAAEVEDHDVDAAETARSRANKADPQIMSPKSIKARVDLQEAAGEARRRRETEEVDRHVRKIVKKTGDDGAALNLVTQGITKASVKDLKAYRDELASAFDGLEDAGKRKANKQLRQMIDKSIGRAENGRVRKLDLERVKAAAKQFSEEVDKPLDKELADLGLIPAERAARSKLIPAAARKGVVVDKERGVIDAEGKPLSNEQLREMRAEPDVEPSYLSQRPNARGAGAYYRSSAKEPTIGAKRRSERPTIEGTFDAHPETLRARAMKAKNISVAARNFRDNLSEVAVRREDTGKPQRYTREKAEAAAANLKATTGIDYTPVAYEPWGATHQQRAAMQEAMGELESPRAEVSLHDSMKRALAGEGDQGSFVLVPKVAAKQMSDHLGVLDPSDAGKLMQAARGQFSKTVLSTSPSPMIGNVLESGFRGALSGSGPRAALTTHRVLKAMDPEARAKLEDRVFTGGRVTLQTQTRHFQADQLSEGMARDLAAKAGYIKRLHGPKQVAAAWQWWTHFVNGYLNGKIERGTQHAMLGQAIRKSGLMGDSVLKLSKTATEQAARGLTGTAEQAALANEVVRMYGKYQGFSPGQRRFIANYTPFAAWWMSAAKFVSRMPLDHPTTTALLAANEQATKDWRELHGMTFFGSGAQPMWLQGTVATSKGKLQATRNTPLGVATDPLGNVAGLWVPQLQSLLNGAKGQDWKGDKLRNDDGTEFNPAQQLLYVLQSVGESSIPVYALANKGSGYAKDPGKLLNPLRIKNAAGASAPYVPPKGKLKKAPAPAGDELNFDTGGAMAADDLNFGD